VRHFAEEVYSYFLNLAPDPFVLSPIVQKMVILHGLNYALDWAAEVTAPFTPQEFFDELHGLADASGVDYQTLIRLNMCVFKY
jgi:hypothetical protein